MIFSANRIIVKKHIAKIHNLTQHEKTHDPLLKKIKEDINRTHYCIATRRASGVRMGPIDSQREQSICAEVAWCEGYFHPGSRAPPASFRSFAGSRVP